MNIFDFFKQKIICVASDIFSAELMVGSSEDKMDVAQCLSSITVEFPNKKEYGDISTNIAMMLAKSLKKSPLSIASQLMPKLKMLDYVDTVEVVPPGFINIRINDKFWSFFLRAVAELGSHYGDSDLGHGEKVNIEYVSANPTGPLHIGHARGAIVGDAVASILSKCGYNVTREYYINDAGKQIDILVESFFIRYKQLLGYDVQLSEGHYPGDYLVSFAKDVIKIHADKFLHMDEAVACQQLRTIVIDGMMQMIRDDLKLLDIRHDVFTSEQHDLIDKHKLDEAIKVLDKAGLLYHGTLAKPKGDAAEDWESSEQLILKTTMFGDESDRPVLRSDGSATYFSSDIAYHYYKLSRGFYRMIVPLGADHIGYAKRLEVVVDALSDRVAKFSVLIVQMVNLLQGGKPVKMSKRAGNFLTLRDIVEELGADILRFTMLTRKSDTVFDIDLAAVREQSKDNPLFYIQYAHTRCVSVVQNAQKDGFILPDELQIIDGDEMCDACCAHNCGKPQVSYVCGINAEQIALERLVYDAEKDLIKQIALMPRVLENAAICYEPHRVAYYLHNLAHCVHQLWMSGVGDGRMRFIQSGDRELTRARVFLVYVTASVIGNALKLLGIQPILKM